MKSLNKVFLIGVVGKDPEIRDTRNGNQMAYFSVATSEAWKDKQDQWQESTEWHNITVFGPKVDYVEKAVRKGVRIYIEGKVNTSEYTDKHGEKKRSTGVIANELMVLDKKESGESRPHSKPKQEPVKNDYQDDDIPF